MQSVVNPKIDRAAVRGRLDEEGVVVVRDYFPKSLAQQLLNALGTATPWDLAYSDDGRGRLITADVLGRMSPQDVRAAIAPAFNLERTSRASFQFVYNTHIVPDARPLAGAHDLFVHRLADAMHEPEHLDFVRELTGRAQIQRMSVMAARYLPGHFLTLHDDVHEGERREVAYVLNLTKDWRPEWGGLLHLCEPDLKTVIRTFTPEFNTMVLMRPPIWHFVSQVASYAQAPRYTLTGWMLGG